jgi:hypothetical protein
VLVVPVVPVALVPLGPMAEADALSSVPVISTLWPTCPFSLSSSVVLSLYVVPALADMLLEVVEVAPAVDPDGAVVPDGDVVPDGGVVAVDVDDPDGDVAVDEVAEPAAPAGLNAAFVSVQLPSEP